MTLVSGSFSNASMRVDVGGADDRVAADADGGREAEIAQLVHHLVGQRAGLGHQPDRARAGDVGRRDADQRLARRDDAGAVGPDDAGLVALRDVVGPRIRACPAPEFPR